jgi:hypothetical protein
MAGGVAAGTGGAVVVRGLLTVAANGNARRAAAALLVAALEATASSAQAAQIAKGVIDSNPYALQMVELDTPPAIGQEMPGGYRVIAVFAGE